MSSSFPSVNKVIRSAASTVGPWAGQSVSLKVRNSKRSATGVVASVSFSSLQAAQKFSNSWFKRLPSFVRYCAVRYFGGGLWVVSVPVQGFPVQGS